MIFLLQQKGVGALQKVIRTRLHKKPILNTAIEHFLQEQILLVLASSHVGRNISTWKVCKKMTRVRVIQTIWMFPSS